jgi:hypothetical protein
MIFANWLKAHFVFVLPMTSLVIIIGRQLLWGTSHADNVGLDKPLKKQLLCRLPIPKDRNSLRHFVSAT